jgi:hypothetical protein
MICDAGGQGAVGIHGWLKRKVVCSGLTMKKELF